MAAKLSLLARKNIKECEEKMTEVLGKIHEVTGLPCDVTNDTDYAEFEAHLVKLGRSNTCGSMAVSVYEGLLGQLTRQFKDDTAKTALHAQWTTGVVKIVPGTKGKDTGYHNVKVLDGSLVITLFECTNLSDCGQKLLDSLGDADSGLPVKAKLNWQEYEEKRAGFLEQIKENTQLPCDVTLDVDLPTFGAGMEKTKRDINQIGSTVSSYLDAWATRFKREFPDDLTRAALHAVWTTGVMRFEFGTKKKDQKGYSFSSIQDGNLLTTIFEVCNVSDVGNELRDQMQDPALQLPLKSAQNIKENEEKRDTNLEKIKETVGLPVDVSFEVDWQEIWPHVVAEKREGSVGSICYSSVLDAVANRMTRICKEELTKEAIAENWTTGVLKFVPGTKDQKKYHICDFEDGSLVIKFKPGSMCTNVSDIGNDIEEKL